MLPGYLLALREGLEAALVIGIVFSVLAKMNQKQLGRTVWIGVLMGVIVSLISALILHRIGMAFDGQAEEIFEATAMLLAAAILTWMVFWVRKQSSATFDRIEQSIKLSISRQSIGVLFSLAFLAVVREGIELALFLLAIRLEINPDATLFGALLGVITAVLVGVIVFSSAKKLSLSRFFQVTNILLALFAAGLVGLGVHELNELGWVPSVIDHVWNLNPILPEQSTLGQLLKAMVGYKSEPSLTMVIAYFGYYLLLFIISRIRLKNIPQ
ncbi:MAG: FTR1 family protein [Anaerolineaceae bacterium]|nr:FTR1 family protein [Anaerolineaceae bacterium]